MNILYLFFKVLTQQLADVYETDSRNISNNFNNNKDKFIEGKHYFLLQGDDLKNF
ncbi:ORF6N domain-containing protein, partial [Clostridioides difficile]|uniref:ORF6N domain-containing protein n=1 Tax=Clostridioides difficile TaxID=1496 RepID=UPI00115F030B